MVPTLYRPTFQTPLITRLIYGNAITTDLLLVLEVFDEFYAHFLLTRKVGKNKICLLEWFTPFSLHCPKIREKPQGL